MRYVIDFGFSSACLNCFLLLSVFADRVQLTWRCSVCRRKMASRVCIPQDSTDSTLDVPIMDALQRRHSDVKLGSSQQLSTGGLAPPRSPELRRHSDVSPASLKELEKVNCMQRVRLECRDVYLFDR